MAKEDREGLNAPGGSIFSSFKVHHLVGGFCGGVTATLITHPFDLIKLRLAGELSVISVILILVKNCWYVRPHKVEAGCVNYK